MKTVDAINGTEERKYACPMFYVPQRRTSRSNDVNSMLYGSLGDAMFIPANQKLVSQEACRLKMIGMIRGQNDGDYPEPVDLVQTLSEKRGNTYVRWRLETRNFQVSF